VREHVTSSGLPGIFTDASLPVDIGIQPSAVTPSYSAPASVCNGNTAAITLNNSQIGIRYQIRRNSDNSNIGAPVDGNGGTITLTTTAIISNTTYNIYAYTLSPFNCNTQLSNPALTFTVNALPVLNYGTLSVGDQSICSGDIPNNISFSTVPSGGSGTFTYQWYSYTGLSGSCPSGTLIQGGWTSIPLATSDNFTPTSLTSSMSYAAMVTPTGSPLCGSAMWAAGCRQVTVTPLPVATFNYSGTPYCQDAANPLPGFSGGGVAGTFSSTPGLVFVSPATGQVDITSSTPGSYSVTNTIAAAGGCGIVIETSPITILSGLIWNGSVDSNWNIPGNWSCGNVPNSTTPVQIPDVPNKPVLSAGAVATVNNLIIDVGSSLTISGNTLQISGTITNNGTFTSTSGTIEMNGSVAQFIGSDIFAGNTINNLEINNSAGVTLQGPLNVSGIITLTSGDLNSSGNLTLASSAAQTGLIDGSGAGNVTGNVTIQRYLSSGYGYKYFSSPFTSATVNEFSDELISAIYKYDENRLVGGIPASGWINYNVSTNVLNPLTGYAVNFGSNSSELTVDMTGVVNDGTITIPVNNNNQVYTKGFNLVGNPYPSPIDWDAPTGWSRTNIDNALYYFKASTTDQYGGTYSTYINGVSNDGITNKNIIPSMQGFFIHVSNGVFPVTGTLALDNSVRITDLAHSFIKSGKDESKPLLRLTARFSDDPASADPVVVYFDDNASTSFDSKFDALKLMNTDLKVPNFYSAGSDGSKLSINALPSSLIAGCTIPLGIKTSRTGNVVFKIPAISSQLPVTTLYLTDLTAEINQDMLSGNEYSVQLTSGEYPGRFFLYLNSSPTNITDPGYNELSFKAYFSEGMVIIDIDLPGGDEGRVIITNLTGQPLFSTKIFDSGHYEFDPEMKPGLYIITFINGIKRISKKIIVE
jgi:hypothetical protein